MGYRRIVWDLKPLKFVGTDLPLNQFWQHRLVGVLRFLAEKTILEFGPKVFNGVGLMPWFALLRCCRICVAEFDVVLDPCKVHGLHFTQLSRLAAFENLRFACFEAF